LILNAISTRKMPRASRASCGPGSTEGIKRHVSEIDDVIVTMDSHHRFILHINQLFWQNAEGNPPNKFMKILSSDRLRLRGINSLE
jgi:hypothetical protein